MKIVLNKCYGGFGISLQGIVWLADNGMKEAEVAAHKIETGVVTKEYEDNDVMIISHNTPRNHPLLIKGVETMGSEFMSGRSARLAVETMDPGEGVDYYDGLESVKYGGDWDVRLLNPVDELIKHAVEWVKDNTTTSSAKDFKEYLMSYKEKYLD